MKTLFSIAALAIVATVFSTAHVDADNATGTCNSIVANVLGTAQYCARSNECTPGTNECLEATNALFEFFSTPGCAEAFANGELNGLGGNAITVPAGPNAGDAKNLSDVICGSILDCGLCPAALMFGVCPETCM